MASAAVQAVPRAEQSAPPEGRVLVVEDDESIGRLVRAVLHRITADVVVVNSAEGGIEELQAGEWDLLLTDIWLPGMNGIELTQWVRARYPSLLVITMTAHGGTDVERQALASGADGCVKKPFAPAILRALVADLLEQGRQR
jgi:DNA-binding response OmpR family regulator